MLENKKIETDSLVSAKSLYISKIFAENTYPWQILSKIGEYIKEFCANAPEEFSEISSGVFVGEDVVIAKSAVIEPPAIIGKGTVIRPGAYLRGKVIIGEGCVIGNSTEIKNAVLSDKVQVPHYNYVGDSVLGYHAHMGAGAICSNFKLDGKNVNLRFGEKKIDTGMRKFGAIIGDNVDIGCNTVLNPGTVIGKSSAVYPLLSIRGFYPENSIIKDKEIVVKKEISLCAE